MSYVMAAGAVMGAAGAYSKAKTQKSVLGYEAAVARNNQIITDYQADIAEQVGAAREQSQRLKTAGMVGDQRAALAANGVDVGQGSAAEIVGTSKFMGERDALTIRDNAAREAWALREQGKGYGAEAAFYQSSADSVNPGLSAFTSLLNGASQVAGSWYANKKATAPKG